MCGYAWVCMGMCEYVMGMRGYSWVCVGMRGHAWVCDGNPMVFPAMRVHFKYHFNR